MNLMVGRAIAFIQVPNQRLFGPMAAARYLGVDTDTLKKYSALGQLQAYDLNGRRAYRLDDLDLFIERLPQWDYMRGEKPAKVSRREIA